MLDIASAPTPCLVGEQPSVTTQSDKANSYTHYIAGLMFDHVCEHVALIEKIRPQWQAGKLNAIGGHLEPFESIGEGMVREFAEETGLTTEIGSWLNFATLFGRMFVVDFFVTVGPVRELKTTTEERVVVFHKDCVSDMNSVPNLAYLIPMSLLALKGICPKLSIEEEAW